MILSHSIMNVIEKQNLTEKSEDKITVEKDLVALSRIFKTKGFSVYLVGGALRDKYLKRQNYDIDIATDAKPEDVISLFKKTIPTGIEHGTVTIRFRGRSIECTTMRREEGYTDFRHPDHIEYGSSIQEDLSRRDFTMNAIAASLPDGKIIDPFCGRLDIENSIIRAVGNAKMRFLEDALRPIRAIRFVSQLGFEIESKTMSAIPEIVENMKSISIERFRDELNKMLIGLYFEKAFCIMKESKILQFFLSEVNSLKIEETDEMLRATSKIKELCNNGHCKKEDILFFRLSLLCYWVYKKDGIKIVKNILKRLKHTNKMIERVLHILPFCNFNIEELCTHGKVRHFIKDVGKENIKDVLMLKQAVMSAMTDEKQLSTPLSELSSTIDKIIENGDAINIQDLAINGNDLISIGIKSGPQVGKTLNALLDIVLERPEKNTPSCLLDIAKGLGEKDL